jgi:hypothetical protein
MTLLALINPWYGNDFKVGLCATDLDLFLIYLPLIGMGLYQSSYQNKLGIGKHTTKHHPSSLLSTLLSFAMAPTVVALLSTLNCTCDLNLFVRSTIDRYRMDPGSSHPRHTIRQKYDTNYNTVIVHLSLHTTITTSPTFNHHVLTPR